MNNHKVRSWIWLGLALFPLVWLAVNQMLPLIANGQFYRVENPVPVVSIEKEQVFLFYRRFAWRDMAGICSNELQCTNQVYEFGSQACPLEGGWNEFTFGLPLPASAEGVCIYRGDILYWPFGKWGAPLYLQWESAPVEVPE